METLFLIGRLLLGGYFVYNAYNHFKNLGHLTGYAQSKKVPMAKEGVAFTGIMMLAGGLSILTGVMVTLGLALLIVFLIGVSFTMHAFWKVEDKHARVGEEINFMKNMALAGALMLIMALVSMPM